MGRKVRSLWVGALITAGAFLGAATHDQVLCYLSLILCVVWVLID